MTSATGRLVDPGPGGRAGIFELVYRALALFRDGPLRACAGDPRERGRPRASNHNLVRRNMARLLLAAGSAAEALTSGETASPATKKFSEKIIQGPRTPPGPPPMLSPPSTATTRRQRYATAMVSNPIPAPRHNQPRIHLWHFKCRERAPSTTSRADSVLEAPQVAASERFRHFDVVQ